MDERVVGGPRAQQRASRRLPHPRVCTAAGDCRARVDRCLRFRGGVRIGSTRLPRIGAKVCGGLDRILPRLETVFMGHGSELGHRQDRICLRHRGRGISRRGGPGWRPARGHGLRNQDRRGTKPAPHRTPARRLYTGAASDHVSHRAAPRGATLAKGDLQSYHPQRRE